jgi:hypothetical protein
MNPTAKKILIKVTGILLILAGAYLEYLILSKETYEFILWDVRSTSIFTGIIVVSMGIYFLTARLSPISNLFFSNIFILILTLLVASSVLREFMLHSLSQDFYWKSLKLILAVILIILVRVDLKSRTESLQVQQTEQEE